MEMETGSRNIFSLKHDGEDKVRTVTKGTAFYDHDSLKRYYNLLRKAFKNGEFTLDEIKKELKDAGFET